MLLHLKVSCLGQSCAMKKIVTQLFTGSTAFVFLWHTVSIPPRAQVFLEGKCVTNSLADPGIPDLHKMLLLCNSRIMGVIINTWRRGVRVVKTIVITHGAMCWRTGCGCRIPGSGQPAELPHAAGNPLKQLSSFPRRNSAAPTRVLQTWSCCYWATQKI